MTVSGTQPPAEGLRAAARGGVRWTTLAAVVIGVTQVVQALVLVRLLDADAFGAMAASMVAVGFAQRFSDMGISYAIVVRDIDRNTLSTLFWSNLLFGLLLGVLVAASAPAVAAFYNDDDVADVVLVLALVLPFSALGSVAFGILQKELAFDRVAKFEIAGAVAGLSAAIVAAVAGAGAVSLALALVTAAMVRSVSFLVSLPRESRPKLRLRWAELRSHLGFGGYQMGERAVTFLSGNLDYLLIGRFLGTTALGYYSIAFQLIIRPLSQLNPVIMRVATPLLARQQTDNAALRRSFLEVSRLVSVATFPALVGLAVVAPAFVPAVLGAEWQPSIVLLQILAFVGLLKTISNPIGAILLAKDRPDLGFKLNVLILVVTGGALYAVVREGTEAVAWAYLGTMLLSFIVLQPWALKRLIGLGPSDYLRAFALPAAIAAVMALATLLTYEVARTADATNTALLVACVGVGAAVYLAGLRLLAPAQWAELKALVSPVGRRG